MYRRTYVFSLAKCLLYHASIKRSTAARVTDEFYKSVVDGLPDPTGNAPDYSDYLRFISVFGTHYARAVEMGSKAVIRSEFEESAWWQMERSSKTYAKAAQASFRRRTGGVDSSSTTEQELAESFDSNRSSVAAAFLGSQPSSDGNWKTWMAATAISPYPIAYELHPLTDLFTTQYFPNISNNILSTKRTLLDTAYEIYCQGIPGCRAADADQIPVTMHRADFGVANRILTRVSCRPGMWLLSCGLENLPIPFTSDPSRCALPVDSTSCECYSYGAVCQPWCTSFNIATVTIVSARVTSYLIQANCDTSRRQVRLNVSSVHPHFGFSADQLDVTEDCEQVE